jgi:hypothetical protein
MKDARQTLVGTWRIEFTPESVRTYAHFATNVAPGRVRSIVPDTKAPHIVIYRLDSLTIVGFLQLTDTIVSVDGTDLQSRLDADFRALSANYHWNGRDTVVPMISVDPRRDFPTTVELHRTRLTLMFNTGICCFFVDGRYVGDSVVGTWGKVGEMGIGVRGRLRMLRMSLHK